MSLPFFKGHVIQSAQTDPVLYRWRLMTSFESTFLTKKKKKKTPDILYYIKHNFFLEFYHLVIIHNLIDCYQLIHNILLDCYHLIIIYNFLLDRFLSFNNHINFHYIFIIYNFLLDLYHLTIIYKFWQCGIIQKFNLNAWWTYWRVLLCFFLVFFFFVLFCLLWNQTPCFSLHDDNTEVRWQL